MVARGEDGLLEAWVARLKAGRESRGRGEDGPLEAWGARLKAGRDSRRTHARRRWEIYVNGIIVKEISV